MRNFNVVLLDLDGTVSDSAPGILASFDYAWKKLGTAIPAGESPQSWIGPPLAETFTRILGSREEAERGIAAYREYYASRGMFENTLYPGIADFLEGRAASGLRLALATSKPEPYARQILEHFAIGSFFSAVAGSLLDHSMVEKDEIIALALKRLGSPPLGACLMVGDRIYDIEGARTNGISSCAVTWGYGNADEFIGCDFLVSSVEELDRLIDGGL